MPTLAALSTSLLLLLSATAAPFAAAADLGIDVTFPATCSRPSKNGDSIAVHYRGRLQSTGVEFDQSYSRGSPFVFVLGAGRVIKGWDQGLLDMCPGEKRTLTVPPELGYGQFGAGSVIPPGATLIFETELMDILGVEQEYSSPTTTTSATPSMSESAFAIATAPLMSESAFAIATAPSTSEPAFAIATAPSTPPADDDYESELATDETVQPSSIVDIAPAASATAASPVAAQQEKEQAECHLLGPFALLVQGALGLMALLTLVYKRWRETPKRPWKVFFFDVSKQVIGSMLTHVLNLAMSMLGAGKDVVTNAAKVAATATSQHGGGMPNPCSFYILNLAIDTTVGIPVLYVLLRAFHGLFLYTPIARPAESIKSGNYGRPPRWTWWLKQAFIYFIGLTFMKLFVWFLFAAMPWLPWVGDWALRWTKGNDALQITFAMFVFPLIMNGLQYWIIDSFIMDKSHGGEGDGYERVGGDDEHGDDEHAADDDGTPVIVAEDVRGKDVDSPAVTATSSLSDGTSTPGSGGGVDAGKKTR